MSHELEGDLLRNKGTCIQHPRFFFRIFELCVSEKGTCIQHPRPFTTSLSQAISLDFIPLSLFIMSSTQSAQPSLERIRIDRANLWYKSAGNDQWVKLDNITTQSDTFNVSRVEVRYSIKVEQRYPSGTGTCSLTLEPINYYEPKVDAAEDSKYPEAPDFILSVLCKDVPDCIYSASGISSKSLADFPLARLAKTFTAIKLRLPMAEFKPKLKPAEIRTGLVDLTTGRNPAGSPESAYIRKMMEGQLAETIAQQEIVTSQEGCRINGVQLGRKIYVEIWPNSLAQKNDIDVDKKSLTQRYNIKNSKIRFPEDIAKNFPIWSNPENKGWSITLIGKDQRSEAPLLGIVNNHFADAASMIGRCGEEDGIRLEPEFVDVLGERSRASLKDLEKTFNDEHAALLGFMTKGNKSKIALRELFLPGVPFVENDKNLISTDIPNSQGLSQRLNESQVQAIEMAISNKVSVVWGPAATGKSRVLAHMIRLLLIRDKSEKIIVCAPTHVAVDNLLKRAASVWAEECSTNEPDKGFVRLFSESEIETQYLKRQSEVYEDAYHIDAQRFSLADRNKGRCRAYLQGRKELLENGAIIDKKLYEAYKKQRGELTNKILGEARVVYCTCTSLRNRALHFETQSKDKKERIVIAWPAKTCIIDEAGCANPLQVMYLLLFWGHFNPNNCEQVLLAPTTFSVSLHRLVLAGDHLQLPAFVLSDAAKKLWPRSFLKDCVDKGVPKTQLAVQYRMHEQLYAAANAIVYDGRVASAYKTSDPSPFLRHLLGSLPEFTGGNKTYKLNSFSNFINVEGKHQTIPNGSSCNSAEVEVVENLVKQLKANGKPASSIAVLTGYLWQLENLQKAAKKNGWSDVRILSVDTSQGDEFDIVIISLVKTEGGSGFMGGLERANVAVTRCKEARYLVGNWDFWSQRPKNVGKALTTMYSLLNNMRAKGFVVQGVQSTLELGPVESSNQDVRIKDEADEELRRKIAEVDIALEENVRRAHARAEEEIRSIRERTAKEIARLRDDAAAEKDALGRRGN